MRSRLRNPDLIAVLVLLVLWSLFFWRLLTPIVADQASFKQGDFSGQFVAFGAYQYQRMAEGEIPLWNPYNNGGLPFIADTQAAVFYPPRWITIGLSYLAGGWTYHALELEAAFHVLGLSLLMYAFVRRLTIGSSGGYIGAFTAAIVIAYGGFISGYPPLQLALLEAAIWLPLSAMAILEATRQSLKWRWLCLAGFALGLSWLAGHPQTSWFATYLLVAWLGYRVFVQQLGWRRFFLGLSVMGLITFGTTAVTFLPGIEYTLLTARADLGFADKGNGFPFQDLVQFVLPGSVSLFSPLYVGVPTLLLICVAIRKRLPHSVFWLGAAAVGLLLSFGANTAFYPALYNLLPGLRFFRGQERAAFIVANSLAVLAGLGMTYLASQREFPESRSIERVMRGLLISLLFITGFILIGWLGNIGDGFRQSIGIAAFSSLVLAGAIALMQQHMAKPRLLLMTFLAGLIVFELFSVNMDANSNYDDIPPTQQLSIAAPPLVQHVLDEPTEQPFRVDGFRGLGANYGSLYGLMDIRGISPLFLTTPREIIYRDYTHNPLAWELFAVRFVFSEREGFSTATTVLSDGTDRDGPIFLHELDDPRSFAHLVYRADVVDSDDFARALLSDPRYAPREAIILQQEPRLALPENPLDVSNIEITLFEPERIEIAIETSENAILSLAMVDYPGWHATLNGDAVELLRAYGALTAVEVPVGQHTLELVFNPLSYRIGLVLSLVTWALLAILAANSMIRRGRQDD